MINSVLLNLLCVWIWFHQACKLLAVCSNSYFTILWLNILLPETWCSVLELRVLEWFEYFYTWPTFSGTSWFSENCARNLLCFFVFCFGGGGFVSCITVIWTSWCCKTTKTNTSNNAFHHLFDQWHNVILHFTYLFDYYEYWDRQYTSHRKHRVNKIRSVKVQHMKC